MFKSKLQNNHGTKTKFMIYLFLLSVFSASIIVRLPNLNRPPSSNHEWLTAITLRIHQIWHSEGALKYNFNPVTTYGRLADKNINNVGFHVDKEGNHYYTSMPPFAYIAPYIVFKILGVYPDVLPLQIFNLFVHFICCLLVYKISYNLIALKNKRLAIEGGLIGFAIYTFASGNLWYLSNVYLGEIFVQVFFILSIYLFQIIYTGKSNNLKIHLILYCIANFLMTYTNWQGVFFSFVICCFCMFFLKKKNIKILLFCTAICTLAAMLFIIAQYSLINGLTSFFDVFTWRLKSRSGMDREKWIGFTYGPWKLLLSNYLFNYKYILYYLFSLLLVFSFLYRRKFVLTIFGLYILIFCFLQIDYLKYLNSFFYVLSVELQFGTFLFLGLLLTFFTSSFKKDSTTCIVSLRYHPVVLVSVLTFVISHLTILDMTIYHDFYVLQACLFICLLISIIHCYLLEKVRECDNFFSKFSIRFSMYVIFFTMCFLSINQYYSNIKPVNYSYKKIGMTIRNSIKNDEVVFMKTPHEIILPHIILYAKCNIAKWYNMHSAKELMKKNGIGNAVVFSVDPTVGFVTKIEKINLNESEF